MPTRDAYYCFPAEPTIWLLVSFAWDLFAEVGWWFHRSGEIRYERLLVAYPDEGGCHAENCPAPYLHCRHRGVLPYSLVMPFLCID